MVPSAWLALLAVAPVAVFGAWSDGHADVDRPGRSFKELQLDPDATAPVCFAACQKDSRCDSWVYMSAGCSAQGTPTCALKSAVPAQQHRPETDDCRVSSGVRAAADKGLVPLRFKPSRLGTVTPTGWLRNQLVIQANSLSGHLDHFWLDVNESVWIGGTFDHSGAGHERGPYWLNGVVPLSAQLNASGDATKPGGLESDLNAQVTKWIYYILDHQTAAGWLGPDDGFGGKGNTYWTGWNVAAALLQYADAHHGEPIGDRCEKAVLDYITLVHTRMLTVPTTAWTQNRWQDWAYIIHWQMDQAPSGKEQLLWDAAELTQQQSWDWDAYYDEVGVGRTGAYTGKPMPKFPHENVPKWDMFDHGVNNAMGTKSCATWYRQSRNETEGNRSYHKLAMQDKYHGQPHGMFSADECFGGRDLNRGIELCAVVEQMYSLQHMFRVHGDPYFLDRCERIAYNSLPATLSSDMWAHQYLQQANEITAMYGQKEHVWQTDGPDSTGFGVAPNFGCCTANFNQGWPKFANNIVLESTADDGIVIALIAPVVAKLSLATVEIITEYPFGDTVTITVDLTTTVTKTEQQGVAASGTPVHIRIPGWATKATVDGSPAKNGTLHSVVAKAGGKSTFKIDFSPEVRVETGWGSNGVSIEGAESVQNGFARFQGALLAGGDLHSGNYTLNDAVSYCNNHPNCAAFTTKSNVADANQGESVALPTYFKEVVTRNTDPAWHTFIKADGPATQPTNAATVLRGALVYSLQLAEEFSVVKEWEPYLNKDFDITTTSTWNYALADLDLSDPSSTLKFERAGAPGAIPFNITGYPSVIHAKVKELPGWTESMQAAKEPPTSPVQCATTAGGCSKETKTVLLVPHGATDLRIAGLPYITV